MSRTLRGLAALCLLGTGLSANAHAQIQIFPDQTPAGVLLGNNYFSLAGFSLQLPLGDNDITAIPVGSFTFGGRQFNVVGVASNGYISVGGFGNGTETNQHFPDPTLPNGVLAPFWADLDPSAGGAVYYNELTDGVNVWNVVDWENVPDAKNHNFVNSFEIWFREGNVEDITFGYGNFMGTADGSGTVGAEDVYGHNGANYYYNGAGTLPQSGDGLRVVTANNVNLPEPASLTLMATGLGVMGVAVRRRRKRAS